MNRQRNIIVDIYIPTDEYLSWYQGAAKTVYATSIDGRSVRFPAGILQKFVTRDGVNGRFCIYFTAEGKFDRIEKL